VRNSLNSIMADYRNSSQRNFRRRTKVMARLFP
jgi:hypothetical protein